MVDITENSQYLTGLPREDPILVEVIDGINQIVQTELIDAADDVEKSASILTAEGHWLDLIGARFELPRPYFNQGTFQFFGFAGNGLGFDQAPFNPGGPDAQPLADESYRKWIIAKGGQLLTDGSVPSMNAVLQSVFPEAYYRDYGDMTMDVFLNATLRIDEAEAIAASGIIPKPAGVRIRVIYSTVGVAAFGFAGNTYAVGFDQAPFIPSFYLS